MIDMHSKYDNMHNNRMFSALICMNNLIITCINCMLSTPKSGEDVLSNKLKDYFMIISYFGDCLYLSRHVIYYYKNAIISIKCLKWMH